MPGRCVSAASRHRSALGANPTHAPGVFPRGFGGRYRNANNTPVFVILAGMSGG